MNFKARKGASDESLPFVKLQDGESVTGLFAGDPYTFYQHWEGERSVICPGKAVCERCKDGKKGTFRFRLNLIVKDGQGYTAKVFEQGGTVYDYLGDLDKETPLEKTPVKILRKGLGKNTSYVILPQAPLTASQLGPFAKVPLRELAPQPAASVPAEEEKDALPITEDDLPFR